MRYAFRRLIHGVLLLVGVSILSFVLGALAPGDYFSELREDPRISAATLDGLRARYGLDRPLPVRYVVWAGSVLRGDFGYSLAYQGPVAPLLRQRVPATILLAGVSTLLAWVVALPLGVWNATQRGTWRDTTMQVLWSLLLAIPELLLAIIALVLAVQSGWLPAGGMISAGFGELGFSARMRDIVRHLALPAAVMVLGMLPLLVRHVRSAMIEVMDAPFALSARAHGIPRRRLLFRHLLPAAVNPLVSLFGLSLGSLLSASLLVEVVMGWPGLGPLFLNAVMERDFAVVLAVVMLSTALLAAGNLAADLLLYRLDPRIRTG